MSSYDILQSSQEQNGVEWEEFRSEEKHITVGSQHLGVLVLEEEPQLVMGDDQHPGIEYGFRQYIKLAAVHDKHEFVAFLTFEKDGSLFYVTADQNDADENIQMKRVRLKTFDTSPGVDEADGRLFLVKEGGLLIELESLIYPGYYLGNGATGVCLMQKDGQNEDQFIINSVAPHESIIPDENHNENTAFEQAALEISSGLGMVESSPGNDTGQNCREGSVTDSWSDKDSSKEFAFDKDERSGDRDSVHEVESGDYVPQYTFPSEDSGSVTRNEEDGKRHSDTETTVNVLSGESLGSMRPGDGDSSHHSSSDEEPSTIIPPSEDISQNFENATQEHVVLEAATVSLAPGGASGGHDKLSDKDSGSDDDDATKVSLHEEVHQKVDTDEHHDSQPSPEQIHAILQRSEDSKHDSSSDEDVHQKVDTDEHHDSQPSPEQIHSTLQRSEDSKHDSSSDEDEPLKESPIEWSSTIAQLKQHDSDENKPAESRHDDDQSLGLVPVHTSEEHIQISVSREDPNSETNMNEKSSADKRSSESDSDEEHVSKKHSKDETYPLHVHGEDSINQYSCFETKSVKDKKEGKDPAPKPPPSDSVGESREEEICLQDKPGGRDTGSKSHSNDTVAVNGANELRAVAGAGDRNTILREERYQREDNTDRGGCLSSLASGFNYIFRRKTGRYSLNNNKQTSS